MMMDGSGRPAEKGFDIERVVQRHVDCYSDFYDGRLTQFWHFLRFSFTEFGGGRGGRGDLFEGFVETPGPSVIGNGISRLG